MYSAMTYIGSHRFSALYGQNDAIVDQKATGLQHLYIDEYRHDLMHTACSVVTIGNHAYFADRIKPQIGHALKHQATKSYVLDHAIMVDEFEYKEFNKMDYVAASEYAIHFKTHITNTSNQTKTFKLSGLTITQPGLNKKLNIYKNAVTYQIEDKYLAVIANKTDVIYASLDAPSGFMYRGIEDIIFNKNIIEKPINTKHAIASSLNDTVDIKPNETYIFQWAIVICDNEEDIKEKIESFSFENDFDKVKQYWQNYLKDITKLDTYENETKTKLVALKGALLDGFLPADLTGHYFADGKPCFYVRDSLMASRAFLYAGLYDDFKSVIDFLLKCETKDNDEFYQRYNIDYKPDEGANNNVFSQIDYIGYFSAAIYDYHQLTNKLACTFDQLVTIIDILDHIETKNGLYGPEGGVNEGVYGPAFIVSTNMFIAAGLRLSSQLAKKLNQTEKEEQWRDKFNHLSESIEKTFNKLAMYPYGYVTYHDDKVLRYDTPQLLASGLGYPLSNNFQNNYETLLEKATYYTYGFGYSEQEYHDGPWLFNTAAAAQTAYLLNKDEDYSNIMRWMIKHQNGFMLLPEAIDSRCEKVCHINPLMWANAEFVVAAYANILKKLREE